MFYSQSLLSRKGPLGTIWIAAYCFKKLKRGDITTTDISSTVDKIMPEIQISHRVLAQLLLGIVKIFSKKVDFLYVECNETLIQITKYLPPTQGIGQYRASARPKKGIKQTKEEAFDIGHIASPMMNEDLDQQIETIRASHHRVTVTLPERYELDSFDLGVLDDRNVDKSHQLSTPQDDWKEDKSSSPSYLIEGSCNEVNEHSGYNPQCFTPLADVLPSGMMDVDLELNELHNSNNFANVQKSFEELQRSLDFENCECLPGSAPLFILHDRISESHMPLGHEQTVPSVEEKLPAAEEPRNLRKRKSLQWEEPSGSGKDNLTSKKHSIPSTSDREKTNISGPASPKSMLATSAIQESSRALRKMKRNHVGSIILSNEIMRQSLHDASDLVCKRRKLPHTDLDIWKFRRFSNPCELFTESLIPFPFRELKKLPPKKCTDGLIDPNNYDDVIPHKFPEAEAETEVLMQKLNEKTQSPPVEFTAGHMDPSNTVETMPNIEAEPDVLMQTLETPGLSPPKSLDVFDNTSENISKAFTSPEPSDNQFDLMELGSHGDDTHTHEQYNGWSSRTRAAAHYLNSRFLKLREQKEGEILSLAQILEGRIRTKCAQFFYETLTLKTFGCIDVSQDFPYGDVSIAATSALESLGTVTK
ncbi:Sister chromatid cohesion 1 protein 3 [Platanthera zijinensis]|uniref:Sister chromatid cohesion 1 protein 3 n=1 Tax=Platanthera zijinensis TaxID=2320716 RepID=A0AAP0FXQ2_9ASPA